MKSVLPLIDATNKTAPEEWGTQLKCPVCSYENVHYKTPEGKESDTYSAWEGRGSAVRIPMWCEGGHEWEVLFGFHKGHTYVGITNERLGIDSDGWIKLTQ